MSGVYVISFCAPTRRIATTPATAARVTRPFALSSSRNSSRGIIRYAGTPSTPRESTHAQALLRPDLQVLIVGDDQSHDFLADEVQQASLVIRVDLNFAAKRMEADAMNNIAGERRRANERPVFSRMSSPARRCTAEESTHSAGVARRRK